MPDADFLFEFRKFLDQHVDCRLETMLTEDDRTAKHEDRTAKLEAKVEALDSLIAYYIIDHKDRINNLEDQLESVDRSQLLKDSTAIIDRRIYELAARGQLRIYVA